MVERFICVCPLVSGAFAAPLSVRHGPAYDANDFVGALRYFAEAVVRFEELRAEAEARNAGDHPFGDLIRTYPANRIETRGGWKHGFERLRVVRAIGRRGKKLQPRGAGADSREGFGRGGETRHRHHAERRGSR